MVESMNSQGDRQRKIFALHKDDFVSSRRKQRKISLRFTNIAQDSLEAAERVRLELLEAIRKLAQTPGMGHFIGGSGAA
jgi:plasmid stabilization system protein ParE